jgi:hypothetical protein
MPHPGQARRVPAGRTPRPGHATALSRWRSNMPQDQRGVLITGHHEGFIDWDTYQGNQQRLAGNIHRSLTR